MEKRKIVLLSAAVIIIAAAFIVLKERYSEQPVTDNTVFTKSVAIPEKETEGKKPLAPAYTDSKSVVAVIEKPIVEKTAVQIKKEEPEPNKTESPIPAEKKEIDSELENSDDIIPVAKKESAIVKPVEIIPEIAIVENILSDIEIEKVVDISEEESDDFTDKELFAVDTPTDRTFYRKKVFVSGKVMDAELSDFSWRTDKSDAQKIETDYAGEFGFYIKSEDLSENLKIYITALKEDGNSHEKLLVLFNRTVKPEIVITKPQNKYEFGRFLIVEGRINIPGHERYIKELIKEARISLSPAGVEENLEITKSGKFRQIIDTNQYDMNSSQKMIINVSLNNYKNSSEILEISKSDCDLVDYDIKAGDKAITVSWDEIPVKANYSINISSNGIDEKIIDNIESPVKLLNLLNTRIYNIQLEAEYTGYEKKLTEDAKIKELSELIDKEGLGTDSSEIEAEKSDLNINDLVEDNENENGLVETAVEEFVEKVIVLKSRSEKVLPLDPESIKPSSNSLFGRIKLKWPLLKAAEKYDLYRKSGRTGDEHPVLTNFRGSSYTDENVTPADTYIYSVEPHGLISVRSTETSVKPSTGESKKIHEIINLEEIEKIKNVFIVNNYAYLITEDGIIISDITDFNNPVYVGRIDEKADYISVDEEYCYIISLDFGLEIYNISNPHYPELIVKREQYKGDFIWSGFPYLFINEKNKGIRVLNVEKPDMPEKVRRYKGLKFAENPVITSNEELFLTAFDNEGKVLIYNIKQEGVILLKSEIETEADVLKAQSSYVKGEMISAVLTDSKKVLIYKPDSDHNSSVRHLIDNDEILDFNFFTAHDERSFLAVYKSSKIDFYAIDNNGDVSLFTSVKRNNGESVLVCNDSSGYAYMLKSDSDLKLYRMMTEGVSYINNSYIYPDKVHDFEITEKYILARTESGIYYSDRNKYYQLPQLLTEGRYKHVWANSVYTAAIDSDSVYSVYTDYDKDPLKIDNEGIRGKNAASSGNYSIVLNETGEVLVFSYDITKNAPHLLASIKRDNVQDIFTFSYKTDDYAGLILSSKLEIFRIDKMEGAVRVSEIKSGKVDKVKCENRDQSVFIDIYSGNFIKRFSFADGINKEIFKFENDDNNITLYDDLIVKSAGKEGVGIYTNINGRRVLISRCSGIFSFDVKYSEGKLYSKGFNTVDEIIPVIPYWYK